MHARTQAGSARAEGNRLRFRGSLFLQMGGYLLDHDRVFNAGNDPDRAAAVRNVINEHRVMLFDDAIEQGLLGPVALVTGSLRVLGGRPGRRGVRHVSRPCDTVYLLALPADHEAWHSDDSAEKSEYSLIPTRSCPAACR